MTTTTTKTSKTAARKNASFIAYLDDQARPIQDRLGKFFERANAPQRKHVLIAIVTRVYAHSNCANGQDFTPWAHRWIGWAQGDVSAALKAAVEAAVNAAKKSGEDLESAAKRETELQLADARLALSIYR